jgi:hypothetical protein
MRPLQAKAGERQTIAYAKKKGESATSSSLHLIFYHPTIPWEPDSRGFLFSYGDPRMGFHLCRVRRHTISATNRKKAAPAAMRTSSSCRMAGSRYCA